MQSFPQLVQLGVITASHRVASLEQQDPWGLGCRAVECSNEAITTRDSSNSQSWDCLSFNEIEIVSVQLTFQFSI